MQPTPDADLRARLLAFLDEQMRRPLMTAEPQQPLSEERHRRLLHAREAVRAEMTQLDSLQSAEDVVLALQRRIETGALDDLDEDVRFLGLRPIGDIGRELAERAEAGGLDQPGDGGSADSRGHVSHERQDRLLDEGIEETFPASDPVSVHQITRIGPSSTH